QHLHKQDGHQDGDVTVAAHQVFHGNTVSSFQFLVSGRWLHYRSLRRLARDGRGRPSSISTHWKLETRNLTLFYRNFAQQLEIAEHLARAQHHAAERIVGDRNRQPGFLANTFVQILEQRPSSGQHDAAVADVSGEFRRGAFERHPDGIHDGRNTFAEGLADFTVVHGNRLGYAFDQVAALDFHGQGLFQRIRGANLHLDLL